MNNKFDYILNLFKAIYSIDFPLDIGYGSDSSAKIVIAQGSTDFFEKDQSIPENVVWKTWNDQSIPFLFDESDAAYLISETDGSFKINYDIIASSFYFLSGWQEHHIADRDEWGRFPYASSIQYKLGIAGIPVVNYYFDLLKHVVEKVYEVQLAVDMWGDCNYATFLSHDIDRCQSGWLEGGSSEVKKGNLLSPIKLIAKKLMVEDVWFNFDEILELENKRKARSTFFFLAKQGKVNDVPNADYDVTNSKFENVFTSIELANSEIAVHGSLGTSTDATQLEYEIGKIKAPVSGNRFHTLAYNVKVTPEILEAAKIKYDASLGFAEAIGFRNGFCFPFFPYDLVSDKPHKVLSIPLMIMDATLQHKKYLAIDPKDVVATVQPLVKEVKKFNGCLSILWHNNFFSDYKFKGWREAYEQLLQTNAEWGSNYLTGNEVAEAFLKRIV
ncbi:MAG: polysaccharide deacetylase family protein [Flavobacteriales bacterium]|nr:polysaccharide deacetylase family protein [Flavobacteriales bacterium]